MIFINYRRRDAAGTTGRLYDHLEQYFHPDELFMDVEDIPPGLDFVTMLDEEVRRCDVFLSVIGPNWLALRDNDGRRLIDRDNDFVRIEIESAIQHKKLIIPVLVDGGEVPPAADLPESIQKLSRRSGIRINHERFKNEVRGLAARLREALADAAASREQTQMLPLEELERARAHALASARVKARPTIASTRHNLTRIGAHDTIVDFMTAGAGDQTEVMGAPPVPPSSPVEPAMPIEEVALDVARGTNQSIQLVSLPGGEFDRGGELYECERPVHKARVSPLMMMLQPVTRLLYAEVAGGGRAPGRGEWFAPVNLVSWIEAVLFCNRLSSAAKLEPAYLLTGDIGAPLAVDAKAEAVARVEWRTDTDGFRLPTETEFEYALRAGTSTEYFWGALESSPDDYAWYGDNADGPQPVGKKQANAWGLFDLAGNVWEWCWDARADSYDIDGDGNADTRTLQLSAEQTIVERPHDRQAQGRAVRGGSYIDPAMLLRSAYRHWDHPGRRLVNLGFRCVRSVTGAPSTADENSAAERKGPGVRRPTTI